MAKLTQFRDPFASLLQSAVDEIVARKSADITRPDPAHPMKQMAAVDGHAMTAPPGAATEDAASPLRYCASLARQYGEAVLEGRTADANHFHELLTQKMGDCDPDWADTAIKYGEFLLAKGKIPYRVYQNIDDYVIDGKLPANARVAIVGDWGTGQQPAIKVLEQIARKNPDVVIHMGDVYYSGTDFEMQNYFYNIWSQTLNLSKIPTFTLSGNHDMFSGGAPYYKLIDQLGQPSSYFCLRNDDWQFVAMDTGLHDSDPLGTTPTYLEDTELAWVADKIQNRGNRRTVLLSHHQLFAANEPICGQSVNPRLNEQLSPLLPNVALWLWGHEHNLVVYQKYLGVLARCIGHGAFPIGVGEIPETPIYPEVPIVPVPLGNDGTFLNHGYVIMDLAGSSATLSYYQDSDEANPQYTETLAASATAAP
jgi:predicted phosphodiesterase